MYSHFATRPIQSGEKGTSDPVVSASMALHSGKWRLSAGLITDTLAARRAYAALGAGATAARILCDIVFVLVDLLLTCCHDIVTAAAP